MIIRHVKTKTACKTALKHELSFPNLEMCKVQLDLRAIHLYGIVRTITHGPCMSPDSPTKATGLHLPICVWHGIPHLQQPAPRTSQQRFHPSLAGPIFFLLAQDFVDLHSAYLCVGFPLDESKRGGSTHTPVLPKIISSLIWHAEEAPSPC
jgi:hypothetical protein